MLRRNYGLEKVREESLRHHAVDAIMVGVATQKLLMKFSEWYKKREAFEAVIARKLDESFKLAPEPWKNFRKDVLIRVLVVIRLMI